MKVVMNIDMSGTLNGQTWPRRGQVADVPDTVGVKMCASGQALPVADRESDVETTTNESQVETRSDADDVEADDNLDDLRAQAAELGLKVHHNAKAETIQRQIDEALQADTSS